MKYLQRLVLVLLAVLCAATAEAGDGSLRDLIVHFEKSGMALSNVTFMAVEPGDANAGVAELVKVIFQDPTTLKMQYNFTIRRAIDDTGMEKLRRMGKFLYKGRCLENSRFLLVFEDSGEKSLQDKVTEIFKKFKTDDVTKSSGTNSQTKPKTSGLGKGTSD